MDLACRKRALSALPQAAAELAGSLLSAEISDNELKSLPPWVKSWQSIQALDAGGNKLGSEADSLADRLADMASLTELSLRRNLLASVPATLGRLSLLTSVDLSQNRITSLPALFCASALKLRTLLLCYNQVSVVAPTSIPSPIGVHHISLDEEHKCSANSFLLQSRVGEL